MNRQTIIKTVQEFVLDECMNKTQAQIYRLIVFDKKSYKEVGEILGTSRQNVYKCFVKANKVMSGYIALAKKVLELK